ncbi:MAG: anti-sigma factor [Acidimicrobiales bacterium]
MNPLTHAETRELLGAFALDAVEPDEGAAIEAHLATCPRCRDEVREHREVAALLAYAGTTAPEGMWDRLAATLEDAPPASAAPRLGQVTQLGDRRPSPRRRGVRIASAVAAAALVAGLGAGGLQVQSAFRSQNDQIKTVAKALGEDAARTRLLREAAAAALADGAHEVHLLTPDQAPIADAVVLANGNGYLIDRGAPSLPVGRTYQLWAVTGGQKLSLGVPGRAVDVVSFRVPEATDALALTVEQSPGVVASKNQAVGYGLVKR